MSYRRIRPSVLSCAIFVCGCGSAPPPVAECPAATSPSGTVAAAPSAAPVQTVAPPAPSGSAASAEPAPSAAASAVPPATLTAAPPAPPPLAKVTLVRFDEPESAKRFERSHHKIDFFRLANQYEAQENGGFCGLASGVIVLNALRVDDKTSDKPRDTSSVPPEIAAKLPKRFDPFLSRYTQGTFMDERFEQVKPKAVFFGQAPSPQGKLDPGLQLRQLGDILTAHGLDVKVSVMGPSADDKGAKKEIIDNLGTAGDFIVVNYFRPALGQPGGGHLSPLGAYDEKSDSFLILDVNANAQRWVWAPAKDLFTAMHTQDGPEARGFLDIREKKQ